MNVSQQFLNGLQGIPKPFKKQDNNPPNPQPQGRHVAKADATVALFGTHSAGKTTLVQAICSQEGVDHPIKRANKSDAALRVNARDRRTADYIYAINEQYLGGSWPKPTENENHLKFIAWLSKEQGSPEHTFNLDVLDPPGEWLEVSNLPAEDERRIKIQDYIDGADFILFFSEPNVFSEQILYKDIEKADESLGRKYQDIENSWNRTRLALTLQVDLKDVFLANLPVPSDLKDASEPVCQVTEFIVASNLERDEKIDLLEGLFFDQCLLHEFSDKQININPLYWCSSSAMAIDLSQRITAANYPTIRRVNQLSNVRNIFIQQRQPGLPRRTLLQNLLSVQNKRALDSATTALSQMIDNRGAGKKRSTGFSIAFVIPKCDQLPGFENASPIIKLIPDSLLCDRYSYDPQRLCQELIHHWRRQFADSTSLITDFFRQYSDMIQSLMNIGADYQIFLVTAVGHVECDPTSTRFGLFPIEGPRPRGVRAPFIWIAERIHQKTWFKDRMRPLAIAAGAALVAGIIPFYIDYSADKLEPVIRDGQVNHSALETAVKLPILGRKNLGQLTVQLTSLMTSYQASYLKRFKFSSMQSKQDYKDAEIALAALKEDYDDIDGRLPKGSALHGTLDEFGGLLALEKAHLKLANDLNALRIEEFGECGTDKKPGSPARIANISERIESMEKGFKIDQASGRLTTANDWSVNTTFADHPRERKIVAMLKALGKTQATLAQWKETGIPFTVPDIVFGPGNSLRLEVAARQALNSPPVKKENLRTVKGVGSLSWAPGTNLAFSIDPVNSGGWASSPRGPNPYLLDAQTSGLTNKTIPFLADNSSTGEAGRPANLLLRDITSNFCQAFLIAAPASYASLQ